MQHPLRLMIALAVLLAVPLAACNKGARTVTIAVPESDIQARLDEQFPITRDALLSTVTLENPRVQFVADNRIKVKSEVRLTVPVLGKFSGSLAA